MHKLATFLLAGALGMGFGGRASAAGNTYQSVKLGELPTPVQTTLNREAAGGRIGGLQKQTRRDGSVLYEAEIVNKETATDIAVSADGTVVERGSPHNADTESGGSD